MTTFVSDSNFLNQIIQNEDAHLIHDISQHLHKTESSQVYKYQETGYCCKCFHSKFINHRLTTRQGFMFSVFADYYRAMNML
mmetsp:Transcript_50038/g.93197  ORF Transcript_50038/g.93197 Transcript_50038/m.93197 type:complete len:82 (-) Transcript_50038:1633-1878(-)